MSGQLNKRAEWMLVYAKPTNGMAIGDYIRHHLAIVERTLAIDLSSMSEGFQVRAKRQCTDIRDALVQLALLAEAVDECMEEAS